MGVHSCALYSRRAREEAAEAGKARSFGRGASVCASWLLFLLLLALAATRAARVHSAPLEDSIGCPERARDERNDVFRLPSGERVDPSPEAIDLIEVLMLVYDDASARVEMRVALEAESESRPTGVNYFIAVDADDNAQTGESGEAPFVKGSGLGVDTVVYIQRIGADWFGGVVYWDQAQQTFGPGGAFSDFSVEGAAVLMTVPLALLHVEGEQFGWAAGAEGDNLQDRAPNGRAFRCDLLALTPSRTPQGEPPTPSTETPTAAATSTPALETPTAPPTAITSSPAAQVTPTATGPAAPTTTAIPSTAAAEETPTSPPAAVTTSTVAARVTAETPAAPDDSPAPQRDDDGPNLLLVVLLPVAAIAVTAVVVVGRGLVTRQLRPGPAGAPLRRQALPALLREESGDEACRLSVDFARNGEAVIRFIGPQPGSALRPNETVSLRAEVTNPSALVATADHAVGATRRLVPVAGWATVTWEIAERSRGHFVPAGSTIDLPDIFDPGSQPRRWEGDAAILRAPADTHGSETLQVSCIVSDGRSGRELTRRAIEVVVEEEGRGVEEGEVLERLPASEIMPGVEACPLTFSSWRLGTPTRWDLRICRRDGDDGKLVVAEGDHLVLDAASLFGEAVDEDAIELQCLHPGRESKHALRVADHLTYDWETAEGSAAASGSRTALRAPWIHTDDGPSRANPLTLRLTAWQRDSGLQYPDQRRRFSVTIEVRPIVIEWIEAGRDGEGRAAASALRVGDTVYQLWGRSAVPGLGVARSSAQTWLAEAAAKDNPVTGYRVSRLSPRRRQELRWRMAQLEAEASRDLRSRREGASARLGSRLFESLLEPAEAAGEGGLAAVLLATLGLPAAVPPLRPGSAFLLEGEAARALGVEIVPYR